MLLVYLEVKYAVDYNAKNLGKMIETLVCGVDTTLRCFEECLERAVIGNRHFAAGFVILRCPENMSRCLQLALSLTDSTEVAAMLVLCVAARNNDVCLMELLLSYDSDDCDGGSMCWWEDRVSECASFKHIPQKILDAEKLRRLK